MRRVINFSCRTFRCASWCVVRCTPLALPQQQQRSCFSSAVSPLRREQQGGVFSFNAENEDDVDDDDDDERIKRDRDLRDEFELDTQAASKVWAGTTLRDESEDPDADGECVDDFAQARSQAASELDSIDDAQLAASLAAALRHKELQAEVASRDDVEGCDDDEDSTSECAARQEAVVRSIMQKQTVNPLAFVKPITSGVKLLTEEEDRETRFAIRALMLMHHARMKK